MDETQKTLINAGRKDLAQQYYKKITARSPEFEKEVIEDNIKDLKEIYKAFQNVTKTDKNAKYRKLLGKASIFNTDLAEISKQISLLPGKINQSIKYLENLLNKEYKNL